jgi:hypothetical protein
MSQCNAVSVVAHNVAICRDLQYWGGSSATLVGAHVNGYVPTMVPRLPS